MSAFNCLTPSPASGKRHTLTDILRNEMKFRGFVVSDWESVNELIAHGVAGCVFYGAYAAKMLGLRLRSVPGWALPALGGSVFGLFVLVWLTAALWFFTSSGFPLT